MNDFSVNQRRCPGVTAWRWVPWLLSKQGLAPLISDIPNDGWLNFVRLDKRTITYTVLFFFARGKWLLSALCLNVCVFISTCIFAARSIIGYTVAKACCQRENTAQQLSPFHPCIHVPPNVQFKLTLNNIFHLIITYTSYIYMLSKTRPWLGIT